MEYIRISEDKLKEILLNTWHREISADDAYDEITSFSVN